MTNSTDSYGAMKLRLTVLMLGCLTLAGVILVRAAYIQLFRNTRLETMARRQYTTHALIRPQRGAILDRNGEPLAVNVETKSLAANPNKIEDKPLLAKQLARSIDLPYSKLLRRLNEKKEFIWIKRHLTDSEFKRFKKTRMMDSSGDLTNGLWLVNESERIYPHGSLASHIVGDVNVDTDGIEGVELWMNDRLRGKVASITAIKDALGRPTFIDSEAAKSVQDGETLNLTIDATLQFEVEQHLKSSVLKAGAKGGTVIVMNAVNGEILALANEPSFNPNDKNKASADRRRNRALTDGYEPGSTFKTFLLAAALSHGWKLTDQVWAEKGSYQVQNHRITEAEAHEKFDWVSLKKMIQVSSNVAAAKIALKLGADRYLRMIRQFGFGTKTGSGFPGEISGRIPSKKEWRPLTLANIGFGQGLLVTPIQMVRAYGAILNGGWLVKPSLIKRELTVPLAEPPMKILSEKTAFDVIEALESVTEEGGTGKRAALAGYRVAGKTGTAQLVDPVTGKYSRSKYIASFIGFPVDLHSKIVIYTALSEPRTSIYAAATAAPLFREVLSSVASRYSLPMKLDPTKILAKHNAFDKIRTSQASVEIIEAPKLELQGDTENRWTMPNLKGLTPREALQVLKGHRFRFDVTGTGVISQHSPLGGKSIAEGDLIRLVLSEP